LNKRLTSRAQRILAMDAQIEARKNNAEELLPEHIIIALLNEGRGTACRALLFLGIDLREFRENLEQSLSRMRGADYTIGTLTLISGDLLPAKRTRQLLENAAEEARMLGRDCIGTEHFLFAAMREHNMPVRNYLSFRAVDVEMLRAAVETAVQPVRTSRETAAKAKPAVYPVLTPALDEFSRDGET